MIKRNWFFLQWFAVVGGILLMSAGGFTQVADPFDSANQVGGDGSQVDPFGKANALDANKQGDKDKGDELPPPPPPPVIPVDDGGAKDDTLGHVLPWPPPFDVSLKQNSVLEHLSFDVAVKPTKVRRGETLKLIITGKPSEGHHSFPINKLYKGQLSNSKIKHTSHLRLKPLNPIAETEPGLHTRDGTTQYEYNEPFTFTQEIYVKPEAKPGRAEFEFQIYAQVCDENTCKGPVWLPPMKVAIEISDEEPATPTKEIAARLEKKAPPPTTNVPIASETPTTFFGLLLFAFVGAFIMLLTPCVFPMIPITVNFFLKQSEKKQSTLLLALIYSGTIIVLLTLVMLVFGSVVISLARAWWFNLALGAILIFFALSLFGMYELELPSGLARFTSAREGSGGYLGAIFMALTFTITSFACTGPFLGMMMAPVASFRPPAWQLAAAALVYSTTFAAPFFVLALFPTLLKALPKSGGWLNTIKVTMGFVELAAALKFLANTDMAFFPGDPKFLNNDTVLCAWIACSVACGLYLIGVFRLPHDEPEGKIGVVRMLFAAVFMGLALYMTPLLFDRKPDGLVSQAIVAFLPQPFGKPELEWHKDYEKAWKEATEQNKLIFIDFTGVTCQNCRDNEENVFPLDNVKSGLKNYVRLQLYTDWVPDKSLSTAKAHELGAQNEIWQEKLINDVTLPSYVIFRPDPKKPFTADGLPNGEVLGKRGGKIVNAEGFAQFLQAPVSVVARNFTKPKAAPSREPDWHSNFNKALKIAQEKKKLLFLDFTGVACVNCKINEETVFPKSDTKKALDKYVKVRLYTDEIPDKSLSEQASTKLAERNLALQETLTKTTALPTYVIFRPSPDGATKTGTPSGDVIGTRQGLIVNRQAFIDFLEAPHKKTKTASAK